MAFRGIIDNTQSYLQSMNMMRQGLKEALGTLAEIKALKGKQIMEQNIREAMSLPGTPAAGHLPEGFEGGTALPPATPEQRLANVNQAITRARAGARPKDFLAGLWSAFNPNVPTFLETTPVEELITQGMAGKMFEDPLIKEQRQATLESTRALTKERERRRVAIASDLTPDEKNYIDLTTKLQAVQNQEPSDPAVIKAIQTALMRNPIFKKNFLETQRTESRSALSGLFPTLVQNQTRTPRRAGVFGDKVYGEDAYTKARQAAVEKGNEYGIDPSETQSMFDSWWDSQYQAEQGQRFQKFGVRPTAPPSASQPGALPEGTGIGKENIRLQPTSPRPELNAVWPKLSDEQKYKVRLAMDRKASVEQILEALSLEGIR